MPVIWIQAILNEDGHLDIVSFTVYGPLVLLGNGDGTFEATDSYPRAGFEGRLRGGYVVDVDEDGHLDLVHGSGVRGILVVNRGRGDGTFHVADRTGALDRMSEISFADLDHDGHLDLVKSHAGGVHTTDALVLAGVRDGLVDGLGGRPQWRWK